MLNHLDSLLNKITMYRLVLYYLIGLLIVAAALSLFGVINYNFLEIILSTLFLVAVCWVVNKIFSKTFEVPANLESAYISGLILALVITPAKSLHDYAFLFWAAALAMASKYILALFKKHIFNPVALSLVITSFVLNQSASWWVGTLWMLPFVLAGGILIVRKIQRWDMVFYFLFTAFLASLTWGFFQGTDVIIIAKQALADSPLFFFAFIMLTEPTTTPPTNGLQIVYGAFVGFLFAPQVHLAGLYFSPELALITGNIFSYIVSPKQKLMLTLKEKIKLSPDVYNFVFSTDRKINFKPGQYLEWTLGHKSPDSRGNRRYFTVASSPTEKEIIMGIKFYQPSSSFKKSLMQMEPGQKLMAGQLAGDFIMPNDKNKKLAFIAGGIGVTPFRSMVKYLIDSEEKRDVAVFYAARTPEDLVYEDVFKLAKDKLNIPTFCAVSNPYPGWSGHSGYVDEQIIKEKLPDYRERIFYISGSKAMVDSFKKILHNLHIPHHQIKTDFFPGFA